MWRLANKHVLLAVCGGIAAYKSAELIRRLRELNASVRVVMTRSAQAFVTPLTLQTLSGHAVHDKLLDPEAELQMSHIALARWADVVLVIPASAHTIAGIAQGQAGDLLGAICLATTAPLAFVPAMNQQMWRNAATQENIQRLEQRGAHFLGPAVGIQACGEYGPGRMIEVDDIVHNLSQLFTNKLLTGKRILITAGPTREPIDPIRFLSNRSSGKMGYALAEAAIDAGAIVTLISGPTQLPFPERAHGIKVETAQEMLQATLSFFEQQDLCFFVAAVADYRYHMPSHEKLDKSQSEVSLPLIRNPDIAKTIASQPNAPFCVGFSAEAGDKLERAEQKRQQKNLDLIVANNIAQTEIGFDSDENIVTILWEGGEKHLEKTSKSLLSRQLIKVIAEHYHAKHSIEIVG